MNARVKTMAEIREEINREIEKVQMRLLFMQISMRLEIIKNHVEDIKEALREEE